MSNKTTTIRFNTEEKKLLDLYMEFQSIPLSTIIKDALFDDIYDFFDSAISEEALEYNKINTKKYTSLEVMEELGINEE